MSNNLIRLIGYIGKNLTATTVATGHRRIQLRMATHYTTQLGGTKRYHTVWHDVVAWGQTAEYAERSFVKGSKIMVEVAGRISVSAWMNAKGEPKGTLNFHVNSIKPRGKPASPALPEPADSTEPIEDLPF